jgi:integrase
MHDQRIQDYRHGIQRILRNVHVPKSSLPMQITDMKKMLTYLDDGDTGLGYIVEVQLACIFSLSWVAMLRMDECLNIKWEDLTLNKMETRGGIENLYHEVKIRNRKIDEGKKTTT